MEWASDVKLEDGLQVAVVGAGLVGLAAAYYLRLFGATVTLIDKSLIGEGIPKVGLTKALSYSWNVHPGDLTEQGIALATSLAEQMNYGGSLLDVRNEAFINNAVNAELKLPRTLPEFAQDLAARCRHMGVNITEGNAVTALLVDGIVVHGIVATVGPVLADEVVVCAGLDSQQLLGPIGLRLRLKVADNRLGASRARQGISGVFIGSVPITPSGFPYVGRPEGLRGLYLGVGHDTNPAAAIAVGRNIANALCKSSCASVLPLVAHVSDYSSQQSFQ